jgi:hypothetical protein
MRVVGAPSPLVLQSIPIRPVNVLYRPKYPIQTGYGQSGTLGRWHPSEQARSPGTPPLPRPVYVAPLALGCGRSVDAGGKGGWRRLRRAPSAFVASNRTGWRLRGCTNT